jgi:effector-binding domain-containing protein
MKILKILGIIILVIVVLLLGVVILGPSSAHFEREATIEAPANVVFAEVTNMKTFNEWSPWFKMDPEAEYIWEGPSSGVGAKQTWFSEDQNVGNGYMMVSEATPNELVILEMGFDQNGNRDFTDEGEEMPMASFIISEDGESTKLTWTFDITGVSGLEKLMTMALPMFLGPAYEEGLARLKERIENGPDFTYSIEQVETKAMPYVGVEANSSSDPEMIGEAMGNAYGQIMAFMEKEGIEMAGVPICIMQSYDEQSASMICGIPTADLVEVNSDPIMNGMTYEGLAIKTIYKGDYALMEGTHNDMVAYADYYNFEINGNPWEVYVTDPMSVPDTSQWITEIYYPIK